MPRLIWVFPGHTLTLLVLSCRGSSQSLQGMKPKVVPSEKQIRWVFDDNLSRLVTKQQSGAPSEDSDQPGHPPSLIRVFAVRMKKAWVLSYPLSAQRRLWSDWADAQADPSFHWVHMPPCWFCHEVAHLGKSFNISPLKSVVRTHHSLESPCWGNSNEYPQHAFLWRFVENNPLNTQNVLFISPNKHCGPTYSQEKFYYPDSSEAQRRKINIPVSSVLLIVLYVPQE